MSTASTGAGSRGSVAVPSTGRTLVSPSFSARREVASSISRCTSSAYTSPCGPTRRANLIVNHPRRAEVRHHRPIGDPECVHDLLGLLPQVAIGALELAEVLRWKSGGVLPLLRWRLSGGEGRHRQTSAPHAPTASPRTPSPAPDS